MTEVYAGTPVATPVLAVARPVDPTLRPEDTVVTVDPSAASNLGAIGNGEYVRCVLAPVGSAPPGWLWEIVYVTAKSGGNLTVQRGQEGTMPGRFGVGTAQLMTLPTDASTGGGGGARTYRATLTLTAAEVLAATDWVSGTWPAFATAPSGKFIMPGSRLLVRSGAGTDGREYGELSFVAAFYGDTNPDNSDECLAWEPSTPIEGLGADNPAVAMPFPLSWWNDLRRRNPEDMDGAALRLSLPDTPWVGIPASYTIATPGDDYAVGDTITLTDGAVLTVLTISGGGGTGPIATFAITTPSEARTAVGDNPGQGSSSGAGTGAAFVVATLDPDTVPVADLTFTLEYTLEDV